ncbi:MAG: FimV/HubP family polar landmark protein [Candidatus Thiodiazotropha sp.]
MIRKLSLAVAVISALSPMSVLALGLGEIHPQSALNQSFKADIDLLSVTQEELQDIRVSLASMEVFEKAGMDRPYLLTNLKFTPQLTASGKPVISITSKDPIREPFLNFLIEINWPKGRLVREFTVLLDPPVTLRRKPGAVNAPVVKSVPVTRVVPSRRASTQVRSPAVDMVDDGGSREYGPVQPNDNLWNIAKQMRQGNESIEQVMMALLNHNPSAFINSNVNALKVGKILRLPEGANVTSLSKSEARDEFLAQTRVWRSGANSSAPISTTKQDTPPSSKQAASTTEDRLKLISAKPGAGETASREGMAETSELERLQHEIMLVRESNEGALQENDSLRTRVKELENQIQDIQRLLTLKNDQLAEVQAAQSIASEKMEEAQSAKQEPTEAAAEEPMPEPTEDEIPVESIAEEPAVAEVTEPVEPIPDDKVVEEVDIETTNEAEQATVTPESDVEPMTSTTEVAAPADEPAVKPPVATFPKKKVGYFDGLKENTTVLAIIGGAGALLIGLMLMIMRRRKEAEAEFAESILLSPDSELASGGVNDNSSLTSPTDETSFMSDFSPSDIDALQDETGEVDPLSEADVYIAYGRYQQAEELIKQAVDKFPDREELKHKLLEIYFSAKKSEAFSALAQQLHDGGLEEQQPDTWMKIAVMGKELNPGYALFAGAEGDLFSKNEDLELNFDSTSVDEPEAPIEQKAAGTIPSDLPEIPSDVPETSLDAPETPSDTPETPLDTPSDISDELDSIDLNGLEDLDEMDSEAFEADLVLDSEFLNKMDGVDESLSMDDSDALDIDLSQLEVDSVSSGVDSKMVPEEPLPFDLSDVEEEVEIESANEMVDSIELEDSESLDHLDLESIEKELEGLSSELDSKEQDGEDMSLLHSHSENLDLDSTDEITTKLDLARAYIDMGDNEGAKSILEEVVNEGSALQQKEANELLGTFTS